MLCVVREQQKHGLREELKKKKKRFVRKERFSLMSVSFSAEGRDSQLQPGLKPLKIITKISVFAAGVNEANCESKFYIFDSDLLE